MSSRWFTKNTFTRSTFRLSIKHRRISSMRSTNNSSTTNTRIERLRRSGELSLPNQHHNLLLQKRYQLLLFRRKFFIKHLSLRNLLFTTMYNNKYWLLMLHWAPWHTQLMFMRPQSQALERSSRANYIRSIATMSTRTEISLRLLLKALTVNEFTRRKRFKDNTLTVTIDKLLNIRLLAYLS